MVRLKLGDVSFAPTSVGGGVLKITTFTDTKTGMGIQSIPAKADYELIIRKKQKKRSLTANAYMWKLCDEIAKAIRSTKEAVYRKAIKDVGKWDIVTVADYAFDRFKQVWESHGIGWVVDRTYDTPNGYQVIVYYGSSTYTSKEMARLIDWLVDEANELGIDTMTPQERSLLVEKWEPE